MSTKSCIACQDQGVLTYACLMDDTNVIPLLLGNIITWFGKYKVLFPQFEEEITRHETDAKWHITEILQYKTVEERYTYCNWFDSVSEKAIKTLLTDEIRY